MIQGCNIICPNIRLPLWRLPFSDTSACVSSNSIWQSWWYGASHSKPLAKQQAVEPSQFHRSGSPECTPSCGNMVMYNMLPTFMISTLGIILQMYSDMDMSFKMLLHISQWFAIDLAEMEIIHWHENTWNRAMWGWFPYTLIIIPVTSRREVVIKLIQQN